MGTAVVVTRRQFIRSHNKSSFFAPTSPTSPAALVVLKEMGDA